MSIRWSGMNKVVFTILLCCALVVGCTDSHWTSGFMRVGFKESAQTEVHYKVGGTTTVTAYLESEAPKKLKYPIVLKININGELCEEVSIKDSSLMSTLSITCIVDLGPGMHIFDILAISNDDFSYLSEAEDNLINSINGSITYVVE